MRLRDDDRAVTVQIGAILLFGFLVVSLAIYQATVVPAQNKEVEFRHSLEVQRDLQDLRNAILRTAASGSSQPVSVTLGTQYPPRTLFVNPTPAPGRLRTVGTDNASVALTLRNASAPASAPENVRAFWDGRNRSYGTGALVYQPFYNEYRNAPRTVIDSSVVYNRFPGGGESTFAETAQTYVDGRRIGLVLLEGNYSEYAVGTVDVSPRAVTTSSNTVTLYNATSPITVSFPTLMGNGTVQRLFDTRYVDATWTDDEPYNRVTLHLQANTTYTLSLSEVAVGQLSAADRDNATRATYLVSKDPPPDTLTVNESESFAVEVRDRYNNPVSGKQVNLTVRDSGGVIHRANVTSDGDGIAEFTYTPNATTTNLTVTVSMNGAAHSYEEVVYDGREVTTTSSGVGGGLNTVGGDVLLEGESTSGSTKLTLTLNNTVARQVNVTKARVNFYHEVKSNTFDSADLYESGQAVSATLDIGGPFETVSSPKITLAANATEDVVLEFSGGGNAKFNSGEFVVVTLVYDTGESDVYFISVP